MKTNTSNKQASTKSQISHNRIPENKDHLDSREGEEQLTKGDDITNNKKTHHKKLKTK